MLGDCLEEPTDQTFIEWEDGHQKRFWRECRLSVIDVHSTIRYRQDHTSAGPSRKKHRIEPIHSNEKSITQMSIATKKSQNTTLFYVLATSWLKAVRLRTLNCKTILIFQIVIMIYFLKQHNIYKCHMP